MKIFTIIGDDASGGDPDFHYFCEEGGDFCSYRDKPFTGLVDAYSKKTGRFAHRMSVFKGHRRGYELDLFSDKGLLENLIEEGSVTIKWAADGTLLEVTRVWYGAIVETAVISDRDRKSGKWSGGETIVDVDKSAKISARLDDFRARATYRDFDYQRYRTEPLKPLYDEAILRHSQNRLFDIEWLYVPEDYYDLRSSEDD